MCILARLMLSRLSRQPFFELGNRTEFRSGAGRKKSKVLLRVNWNGCGVRSKELDPVKKLTHYSACFDNDWRFRRLAFCTPTSCLQ
jgi:hypothetical protein